MKNIFKNTLLTTTAVVGVAVFATSFAPTQAFAQAIVDTNNNGTVDGGEVAIGPTTAVNVADLLVSASDVLTAEGDITVGESTTSDNAITATVTGQTLEITSDEADADVVVTIDGDVGLATGVAAFTLDVTAFTDTGTAAENLFVDINGDVNLGTGTMTILADTDLDSNDATVELSGNLTAATVTLTNAGAGEAALLLDGTTLQTVTADVAGDGFITVDNAAGAKFVGTVDASDITIQKTTGNSSATFTDTVGSAITLGGDVSATDVNTVIFDTTDNDFTLTGAIEGANGTETNNISVIGGGTFTLGTASTVNLTGVSVTGTDTVLTTGVNLTSSTLSIGKGATFETTGGITTTDATLVSGATLTLNAGDFTGDIDGKGTVNVDATGVVTGSLGATTAVKTVTVASGADLTLTSAAGGSEVDATNGIVLEDDGLDNGNGGDLIITTASSGNDYTISSKITTGFDSEGTITVSDSTDTVNFAANIGTSSAALQALTIAGAGANVVTSTGNLYIDAIAGNANDELQLIGTSAQAVSGTIDDLILTVGTGTSSSNVTFNGALANLASLTVNEDAKAFFGANAETAGAFDLDGQATVGKTFSLTVDTVTQGAAIGDLILTVGTDANGDDNSATLISGNAIDFEDIDGTTANGIKTKLKVGSGVISNGEEFLIVNAGATVTNFTNGDTIADTSALYKFIVQDGATAGLGVNDSDIVAVASRVNLTTSTSSKANANALSAILDVTAAQYAADTDLAAVYDSVQGAADLDEAAESISATTDGGHIAGAFSVTDSSLGINSGRLTSLRTGDATTGMSAGTINEGVSVWGQLFGKTGEQDQRDGISGFDIDTYGFAVGIDSENVANNAVVGLAFGYGDTDVDSNDANSTETEIDSYQLSLYGDYDLADNTYISGQLAYTWHSVDTTRSNVGGVAGTTATGDFDANQYSARVELGRDYAYETAILTPSVLANWSHYDGDNYTETGAGGANLAVDQDGVSIFEVGVGLDAKWDLEQASGAVVQPALHVGYRYDFIGDEVETSQSFTGGGTTFQADGFDPAQSTFDIGAAVTYYTVDNWEFTADYTYEFKEDYDSHAGFVRAGYQF